MFMDIKKEVKNRALKRADELGLTIGDLHKKIGTSYSTLWNFLKGTTGNFGKLVELANELQVPLTWLLTGQEYQGMHIKKSLLPLSPKENNEHAFGPDMLPILGYANASDEAILLNYDEPIGFALRHPSQKDAKKAYFLEIYDESMSPRYYPGELAAINGDKRPLPKRDCAIELVNGEAYIKQFIRMNEKELVCHQLNPPKEWKRPRSQVKAIHAVGGRSDK